MTAIVLFSITAELIAQEKTAELRDFKVIIEKTESGIKLKSVNGSAWTYLLFSVNNNQPQAVDEYEIELKRN